MGDGAGGFAAPVNYLAGSAPDGIAVADFDKDGKLDLAVSDHGGSFNVLRGMAGGTFATAQPYGAGAQPIGIVSADFDGDGVLDVAVANSGATAGMYTVSILIGDGTGLFGGKRDFPVGQVPSAIASDDFNGDSKPDLVVTNQLDATMTVLINTTM
jgi:hypothetical protein